MNMHLKLTESDFKVTEVKKLEIIAVVDLLVLLN